jgi:uncharacterized protein (DUF1330 family)
LVDAASYVTLGDVVTGFKRGAAMPAFMIFNVVSVRDGDKFAEYRERVPPTIEAYGGRYLARGGDLEVLEGSWSPARLTVIEFPSVEDAKRWYDSEEYRPLKELRMSAGDLDGVLVEGLGSST